MMVSFLNKVLIKKVVGVHIHTTDAEESFAAITLKLYKNKVEIADESRFETISQLLKSLKKSTPLFISVTGSKIINKVVDDNETHYLDSILFGKSPDDFYISEYVEDSIRMISLTRKALLNDYINKFQESGHSILGFFVGPFSLEKIKPLIGFNGSLSTPYGVYRFGKGLHSEAPLKMVEKTHIGEDVIGTESIFAFSGLINHLNPENIQSNFEHLNASNKEETVYKKAFNFFGAILLVGFLILLTTSYFLQSFYANKSAEIQYEVTLKNQEMGQIAILKQDLNYKKNIIENSSLGSDAFLSQYIFEITKTVPEEILLTRLDIFPIQKSIRPKEKILITPNSILIEGHSNEAFVVNQWISEIDGLEWVKKTELTSYSHVKSEYQFTLLVQL
ncbi:MAG: hypothetical protein CL596_05910 [Alteromonas sp.]|nr:hypothetical protein [Alteromonas sp.]MAY21693.1 hypothetical protein [Flavobacteriaceae bacterium]|tara:strand:- start:59438 stop:60610 length:1173 start_codon:yes stop_codon:yes gene_type:complete